MKENGESIQIKKIAKFEYSCSCFLMYLGLDKKYPEEHLHSIYFAEDFKKNVDDLFERGKLPDDPSFYLYRPSLMDDSLAPEGQEGLYVLVPVPELSKYEKWTEQTMQAYRQKIIRLLKEKDDF